MFRFALPVIASALALSGCSSGGNESADANANISGRTENGQLTARVQGVDLKVNLPPPIRRMTEADDFLYPGARPVRGGEGQRFHSDDPLERVTIWYNDGSKHGRFSIAAARQEGDAWVLEGRARSGDRLTVRLTPGAGGGTDGTIMVTPAR